MRKLLRMFRGAAGVGLIWAAAWIAFGLVLGVIIGIFVPDSIDPGEGPVRISAILGTVGFITGVAFSALFAFVEARKSILQLSPFRAALWGGLVGTALPLVTTMQDGVALNTGPLGAISAALTVAIARRAARREPPSPALLGSEQETEFMKTKSREQARSPR